MSEFRFFLYYAGHHKVSYFFGIVALFFTNWLAVNIPVYIGKSIDILSQSIQANYEELLTSIYYVVGFAAVMIATRTLSRMLFFNPGRDVERELKDDAFTCLTKLQRPFYQNYPTGALISIVNNDINGVRAMAGVGLMQVFNIFFALSLTPIKMWQLSPTLTLYCIIPMVVSFLVVTYSISYLRRLMKQRMLVLQALSASTVNFLSGVEEIKSHHIQEWAVDKFQGDNDLLLSYSLKQLKIGTFFLPILQYTDGVLKILILGFGGLSLIQGQLSLGELTAFLSYATLLALPFISLGRIVSTFQMGLVSLRSIRRIFTQSDAILDAEPLSSTATLFDHGVSIRGLSYTYPSDDPDKPNSPALKNISFDILPGQKVAILGKVGCGKTTLVNCLNRYLDVAPGQIFLGSRDLAELSRADVRNTIRTITQEPFLFSDTISSNITFGSDRRKDTLSIEEALYQSDMLEEVQKLPSGEQTLVGERGILLSGGQKQRLSLSRGMYTPCKLIVLDNVLSAVDNETERFLLSQIFDNLRSESSLIISHRPAVLERVDKIILLEEGCVVADGSHKQLLESSAVYRDTWSFLQQSDQLAAAAAT
jgi:ATP-binding cassette subfamily B multidrug efflux pump